MIVGDSRDLGAGRSRGSLLKSNKNWNTFSSQMSALFFVSDSMGEFSLRVAAKEK